MLQLTEDNYWVKRLSCLSQTHPSTARHPTLYGALYIVRLYITRSLRFCYEIDLFETTSVFIDNVVERKATVDEQKDGKREPHLHSISK